LHATKPGECAHTKLCIAALQPITRQHSYDEYSLASCELNYRPVQWLYSYIFRNILHL